MQYLLERKKPWIAVVLSIIIAGLGHIYCGQIKKGVILIIIDLILIYTIVGVFLLGLYAIVDSYNVAKDINIQIENDHEFYKNTKKIIPDDVTQNKYNKIDVENFAKRLKKNFQLYKAGIFTENEFNTKKNYLINSLVNSNPEFDEIQFLESLIDLKNDEIITQNDITKIKKLIKN